MPRMGRVVCFFQSAQKFKTRYATFGFSDKANLDEGAMWPTTFALKELTTAEEARIAALVKEAAEARRIREEAAHVLWLVASFDAFDLFYTGRGLSARETGRILAETFENAVCP